VLRPDCVPSHVAETQQTDNLVSQALRAAWTAGSWGRSETRLLAGGSIRAARERAIAALHEHVTRPNLTDKLFPP